MTLLFKPDFSSIGHKDLNGVGKGVILLTLVVLDEGCGCYSEVRNRRCCAVFERSNRTGDVRGLCERGGWCVRYARGWCARCARGSCEACKEAEVRVLATGVGCGSSAVRRGVRRRGYERLSESLPESRRR